MRPLTLANALTKVVMPKQYQNPNNSDLEAFALIGMREALARVLEKELAPVEALLDSLASGNYNMDLVIKAREALK